MELFWRFLRSVYMSWGTDLTGKHDKLIAYILIIGLNFLSIMDIFLDWENYKDLNNKQYMYSIATGPPKTLDVHMLLVFSLIATAMSIVEIVNTTTLICNGGHMKIPVELEQIVALLIGQIPQATINLAISMCRNNILTNHQSASCFIGLINSAARLYLYGFIKERMFEYERNSVKSTLTLAKYITATVLWIVLLLTQAFMWDQGRVSKGYFLENNSRASLLNGVSISLVRLATHKFHPVNQTFSYKALKAGGDESPWLVKDVGRTIAKTHVFDASYSCRQNNELFQPPVCDEATKLKFKFKFDQNPEHFHIKPLGEVSYNYAVILKGVNNTEKCIPSKQDLQDKWHLRYYKFVVIHDDYIETYMEIHKPWEKVCIPPYLRYTGDINVCDS